MLPCSAVRHGAISGPPVIVEPLSASVRRIRTHKRTGTSEITYTPAELQTPSSLADRSGHEFLYGNTNVKEYLQAATTVAMTVVAALESEHASSSNAQAVIQGKDVPADVREEVNHLTQDLYQSAPAEFCESVRYDIEAIEATANAVIVKYVNRSFAD